MLLYTIQIPVARRIGLDKDSRYLDITVKSGDKAFCPDMENGNGFQKG